MKIDACVHPRLAATWVIISICFFSCDLETDYDLGYDFINHFDAGNIFPEINNAPTPTGKLAMMFKKWPVGDVSREAIVTVAGAGITFDVPSSHQGSRLYFGVGARFLAGSGVVGVITVESESGGKNIVYQRYLNPVGNVEERRWFDESVDLSQYDGRAFKITFAGQPAPNGDVTAAWFAWSTPVLTFPRK